MNHNSISRRRFLQLSALAGGAMALTACVPAAAPAGGDTAASGDSPATEGKVVSFWFGWGNLEPAMPKLAESDEWKEIGGGATLEWKASINRETILTAVAGGTPPDAGSNIDYPNLFTRGAVIPVQDMAATSKYVTKDAMLEWTWNYSFFGDQMIGVPGIESYVQYGLNWNSDAAEKAGLDNNNPPTTWNEVFDWHKAMTKKDDAGNLLQFGLDPGDAMGGDVDFGPFSYGVKWYDESTKKLDLDNERMVDYLNIAGEFVRHAGPDQFAGMRQADGNGTWGAAFESGVQTMIIEGYWHPGEAMINKPEIAKLNKASWAPVSDERKGTKMQAVNAHFVQIFKDGKNHQGAFNLGELFNTVKACQIVFDLVGWVHPVKEYIATLDADAFPGLRFYVESEKEATEWHLLRRCPIHWFVYDQLGAMRDRIARDQITPTEAAAELQKLATEEWAAQGLGS